MPVRPRRRAFLSSSFRMSPTARSRYRSPRFLPRTTRRACERIRSLHPPQKEQAAASGQAQILHTLVGLRHDGNNRNPSQRPAHFAWPTHPQAAIRGATSFSCPRSSFAGKSRGAGRLVPVVGQRPARVLRKSRRARSFLGSIRAIFGLRGQGKCIRTGMDDTFLGTAATVLELLFGVTLVLGLALRWAAFGSAGLQFSHGDLVWAQVAIRLLRIRCDVLCAFSGTRRLESMDRRFFTVMLRDAPPRGEHAQQPKFVDGLPTLTHSWPIAAPGYRRTKPSSRNAFS
jgi:hypothetical protein